MSNSPIWRPDSSPASTTPTLEPKHNEADQARVREEFRRRVERVTKLRRVLAVAAIAFLVFAASSVALSAKEVTRGFARLLMQLSLPLFLVFLVALFWHRRLRCPACHQQMFERFGPFCPECGCRSLGPRDPGGLLQIHACTSCGGKFHWGKSAKGFRLRYCSHCGVFLDAKGLNMP